MTNEEAIRVFEASEICERMSEEQCLEVGDCKKCRGCVTASEELEAYEVAKVAIGKQIPKKPEFYKYDGESHQDIYICPVCGDDWNMNEFGNGMVYCWTCGQKIDCWEEE